MKLKLLYLITAILTTFSLYSQEYQISYSGKQSYSLVERTNLRRYVNGKYTGLTSRQIKSFITPDTKPLNYNKTDSINSQWYNGSFYVEEETLRNGTSTAKDIHQAVSSMFFINQEGMLTMYIDNGYPSFRSFPSFTTQKVKTGDTWKAMAERSVDPLNKGIFTKLPMLVRYEFAGEEIYKEKEVYRIKAIWQTSYDETKRDYNGDSSLIKAAGGHKADIIVLKKTGEPLFIIDQVDETFIYDDGTNLNLKGTITLFTDFPPAIQHDKLDKAIYLIAQKKEQTKETLKIDKDDYFATTEKKDSEDLLSQNNKQNNKIIEPIISKTELISNVSENLTVEKTDAGLKLTINNIKFKPDSDQILESEYTRLDEIAKVLKLAENSKFLIEGHTANTGKPKGELELSQQRAAVIAKELSKRGLNPDNFICTGWGGTKPVATNQTAEGRAMNRRVEITILE